MAAGSRRSRGEKISYITVEDFRAGVDRRRPINAGVPGSIWEGINGHLTRGGDFEKRKAFPAKYTLPAGTFGMAATDENLYVFGSNPDPGVPAGVTYQRLQHPDGPVSASGQQQDMTKVLSVELFDGLLYVIAEFSFGDVIHFYNGEVVLDWLSGIVRSAFIDNNGIATHLAGLIDDDAAYVVSVVGNVITIEAAVAGTAFTIDTVAENVDGGVDDQTAAVALTVPNVPGEAEVLSTCTFAITAGTNSAGINEVASILISGVEVLNVAVDWVTSNAVTAANVAAQINTFNSVPEYTATASGDNVTISAAAGTGDGPNAFTVAINPNGDVAIDGAVAGAIVNKTMGGGVDAVAGQAQRNTVTIGGTFEIGDRFTVILDEKRFGADGNPRRVGRFAHTQVNEIWSPAGSIVYHSGVFLPTGFNASDSPSADPGAGSINAATHAAGSSDVTGLEVYQGLMAIFSRRTIQIWFVDEDETLNKIRQTLKNTGTRSPESVVAFSDNDVFYLDGYGIRSLRARDSSNAAQTAGVGALIDSYVVEYLRTLTDEQIEGAVGAIEPEDGRFWLAVGTKVFVFSYFPDTKISGWTWYEPGFQIGQFAILDGRIYARSGDTIYLYGGDANASYDPATLDQGRVTCWIPFLSMNKDGTFKQVTGIDIAATNAWYMNFLYDPNNLARESQPDKMPGHTYSLDDNPVDFEVTHISPKLTCQEDGPAVLSKVTIYFDGEDESN